MLVGVGLFLLVGGVAVAMSCLREPRAQRTTWQMTHAALLLLLCAIVALRLIVSTRAVTLLEVLTWAVAGGVLLWLTFGRHSKL